MAIKGAIVYRASKTAIEFHRSPAFVRQLMGPFGSGKSVACVIELMRLARTQPRQEDGIRRSRAAIVRNTYRELADTTKKTFEEWIPEQHRQWSEKDFCYTVRLDDVECEVLFRALDRPNDVKKLLSLELSFGWLNENREIPLAIFDAIQGRLGRYPRKQDGGVKHPFLICDTNPPDDDHYIYRLFETENPDGFQIFHQPSGRSPEAENLENLPDGYYHRLTIGKDPAWVRIYVDGLYGYVQDGRPVYPEFNQNIHVSSVSLDPDPDAETYVGLDFGLTPAATIMQQTDTGQWRVFDEIVTENMGAQRFAKLLGPLLRRKYRSNPLTITGDPGGGRAQTDEQTPFMILQAAKIDAHPAHTNDPVMRREAVAQHCLRTTMAGQPGLLIDPGCNVLIKGMAGRYQYKRVQVVGDERFQDKPDKNLFSHVCESLQYCMLGAGEDNELIGVDEDWLSGSDDFDWNIGVI